VCDQRFSKGVFRIPSIFLRLLDVSEQLQKVLTPIFVGSELEQTAMALKIWRRTNLSMTPLGCPMDRMLRLSAAGVLTRLRFR